MAGIPLPHALLLNDMGKNAKLEILTTYLGVAHAMARDRIDFGCRSVHVRPARTKSCLELETEPNSFAANGFR